MGNLGFLRRRRPREPVGIESDPEETDHGFVSSAGDALDDRDGGAVAAAQAVRPSSIPGRGGSSTLSGGPEETDDASPPHPEMYATTGAAVKRRRSADPPMSSMPQSLGLKPIPPRSSRLLEPEEPKGASRLFDFRRGIRLGRMPLRRLRWRESDTEAAHLGWTFRTLRMSQGHVRMTAYGGGPAASVILVRDPARARRGGVRPCAHSPTSRARVPLPAAHRKARQAPPDPRDEDVAP